MNWRGFKIELHQKWKRNLVEIVPVCETDDVSRIRIGIIKNGNWEAIEMDCNRIIPDEIENGILRIPYEWAKQLQLELEKLLGSPKVTATESELKATKYHLEDMRDLIFKGKK